VRNNLTQECVLNQTDIYIQQALKNSHTAIHNSLDALKKDNKTEAKQKAVLALKMLAEALGNF
jgi:hypothetical protein